MAKSARVSLRLTDAVLRRSGACADQRRLFRTTFPDGAPLSLAAWRTAVAAGLDQSWCVSLLSPAAWADYERVGAPAWAEYDRVTAAARAKYEQAIAAARAKYERAIAPALLRGLRASIGAAPTPGDGETLP